MDREEIRYKWRYLNSDDYDIIIGEEDYCNIIYRDENGKWTDIVGGIVQFPIQRDFEKSYQLHKREKKLKRICHE